MDDNQPGQGNNRRFSLRGHREIISRVCTAEHSPYDRSCDFRTRIIHNNDMTILGSRREDLTVCHRLVLRRLQRRSFDFFGGGFVLFGIRQKNDYSPTVLRSSRGTYGKMEVALGFLRHAVPHDNDFFGFLLLLLRIVSRPLRRAARFCGMGSCAYR